MKVSEKYEKLMEFVYDEYDKGDTFKGHGEPAMVLVQRFQRFLGIRLGDAGAQKAAMNYLLKQGWIEIVSIDGTSLGGTFYYSHSRIKPTPDGIEHVEHRRQPGQVLLKATDSAAEIIGRGLKGFLGK